VADLDEARAAAVAEETGARRGADWRDALDDDVEAAVVATFNRDAVEVAEGLLERGKHVLVEKPLGRNASEAQRVVATARASGAVLKVGFNHRHHPAVQRAHELASSGAIGPVTAIRAAYGHGGRPGYEREWRADPELSGGGELLDQGVHLLDLCRWFLDEVSDVSCMTTTSFWPIEPVEDNAFVIARTASGQMATLHTSWTQWRNLFRFEIFGRDGYLIVDGLGGTYGEERLVHGTRRPEGGVPLEENATFPGEDVSWSAEWSEFSSAIREKREPLANGSDGLAVARIVDALYESARVGRVVEVERA
jgi:predicted dehydrogenase